MKIKTQLILFTVLFIFCTSIVTGQNFFIKHYNINPVPQSISSDRKDILELSNGDLIYTVYDEGICSIIKTDPEGNFIFGKELSGDHVFEPAQIIELNNTDILIVGRVRTLSLWEEDMSMISLSSSGTINWVKIINEPILEGVISNVYPTMDNNVLITGTKDVTIPGGFFKSEGFIGKVDTEGEILQRYEISNDNFIRFSHMEELENGEILLFGQTVATDLNSNYEDLLLIKLDSDFNEIWSKKIHLNQSISPFENFSNSSVDFEVIDNMILISTTVANSSSEFFPVILNLDMEANVNYVKQYLVGGEKIGGNFLTNQNNEAVYFGGYPKTKLFKMNIATGEILWSKRLVEDDISLGIMSFTTDYDFLFKLESQNTITIGRLDSDLSSCLTFEDVVFEENPVNVYIEEMDIEITNESIETEDFSSFQVEDFNLTPVVFCIDSSLTNNTQTRMEESEISVYPNPVIDKLFVSGLRQNDVINVYDVLGRKIKMMRVENAGIISLELDNNYTGMIIINIVSNNNVVFSEKIIKGD